MSDLWIPLTVVGVILALGGWAWVARRPVRVVFANEREERLTMQLTRMVGCSPAQALPYIQREIEMAPTLPDETILKRASYHYRQEIPETTCQVFRDRTPG